MLKRGGKGGKRKRKDNAEEDPNKRSGKKTKTQENTESLFDTLHDELIINVLVQIPMKYFLDLATTCRRWMYLSRKQDFWRLYAIRQWGENIIPNQLVKSTTGSVEVDLSKHLIPTIQIGGQCMVDWFRYCKIRILFAYAKKGMKNSQPEPWDNLYDDDVFGDDDPDIDLNSYDYDDMDYDSYEDYLGEDFSYGDPERDELDNLLQDLQQDYDDDLQELRDIVDYDSGSDHENNNQNNTNDGNNNLSETEIADIKEILSGHNIVDDEGEENDDGSHNENDEDDDNEGDEENDEEVVPDQSFREAVQELVDQHKKETDSQHENQDYLELTNDNLKNFIVDLPINPSFDYSQPHYLPKVLFEFLYEIFPMVFGASNLNMTSKHLAEVLKNVVEFLEEKGERFAEKYYERMNVVQDRTKQLFDMFICSCKMFLQIKAADEGKKNLFKKLLQTMLDIVPLLLNFDIESELKDLLKNEFTPEGANQEEVVGQLIPEIRNALRSTRNLQEKLPKTCDMTKFRYPSREIAEKSLTSKDPIVPLITSTTKDAAVFDGILAHFIIDKFISVDDLSIKAAALALIDVTHHRTETFCTSILPIVCEATQHAYEEISFGGFVALHKFSKAKQVVQNLTKKQVTMAIEAIVKGITKFPHSTVYLVNMLARFLKDRNEIMSDKLFDEFNTQLLSVINTQPKVLLNPIVCKNGKTFGRFWKMGLVFKERLEKYLPQYREALLHLSFTKFDTSVVIANIEAHPSVIPEENRLLQYVLLGNACLGEKFNEEAEEFVKYLQKQKKVRLSKETFSSLFGDILCRIHMKNNKKLKDLLKNILDSFSADLYDSAIAPAVERYMTVGEDYHTFKTIPFTYKQFQDAVKVFKAKKGRRSGKNMDSQAIFEYDPPAMKKDKAIKKSDKSKQILNNLEGFAFGPTNLFNFHSGPNLSKEISTLGGTVAVKNMLIVLEHCTDEDILVLQRVLHVLLAFMRHDDKAPVQYFEVAMQLFDKLKADLLIENQRRYMQIFALIISTYIEGKEKMTPEMKQVLLKFYDKIIVFYEEYIEDRHLVEFLITFAVEFQDRYPGKESNMMVYNLLKRMLIASPKDTRRALKHCLDVGKFFLGPDSEEDENNPWFIERLHIMAFIGYHFGVSFLATISNFSQHKREVSLDDMFAKCVKYYKNASKEMDAELQNIMKRFIVLYAVKTTTDVSTLCLFNALFSDEEATAIAVVRSKKFDTGVKELNAEAKTWDNIFDV